MGNFSFTELGKDFSLQNQKLNFGTFMFRNSVSDTKDIDIFGKNLQSGLANSALKDKAASIFTSAIDDKNLASKPSAENEEPKEKGFENETKTYGTRSIETIERPGGYKSISTKKRGFKGLLETEKMVVKDKNGKTAFTVRNSGRSHIYEDKNGNTMYSFEFNNGVQTLKNAAGKVLYTCIKEYDPESGETKSIYKDANGKVITQSEASKLENSLRSKEMRDYSKCLCESWKAAGGECTDKSGWFPIFI